MSEFNIELVQVKEEKIEPKELSIEEVAELNAKHFYEKIKKPVIVDDTGIFFKAYPDFPGNHPKLMFNLLGYKGLLKLLEGEDRSAFFKTIAAYYDGITLKTFQGILKGTISEEVSGQEIDVMPYERIFLVNGKKLCDFSREEKNKISHRAIAFKDLAKWLKNK